MQLSIDTRFTAVQNLGQPVSHHPISRSDHYGKAFLACICFGTALVMANVSLERARVAADTDSPVFVNSDPLFIYWLMAAAALLVLAGAWFLISIVRNWNTVAALYEGGVALCGPRGLRQLRWGDVDEVLQSITNVYRGGRLSNTVYVFTVRARDGKSFKFDGRFVNIKDLGEAIQTYATAVLLPRYVQALNEGKRLAFGPLAFDRERLYNGQQSLPWAAIQAVKVHRGSLTVETAAGEGRGWKPVAVAQLPNLWVFYRIVGSLTTII